ncbi:MAG TPA: M28 family peptidase [Solirubrobacteraceae bacterium]|nr:M28 family peptidase [Solirubrobacteraceae bacterium]
MRSLQTTTLADFDGRGAGTDAERRAARWLAGELVASRQRVRIETFWCRPNWALAHGWHAALALVGSLISVGDPLVGTVLLAVALASTVADEVLGTSLGRRLTPERASQNVLASASRETASREATRLIITANYDAGRTGLIYHDAFRDSAARLNQATRGATPGWLGWLAIAISYELAIAIVRIAGTHPPAFLGVLQLPPAVALVLTLAVLLETAGSAYGPGANDNGAGVAVAIALTNALATDPPRNLTVDLVLQGAGDSQGIGLRRYLRTHKHSNAIVVGVAATGAGEPVWWISDGRLVPLRYARTLRALCAQTGVVPHRGRGVTPALLARATGLPAIAIGCLDDRGLAPRSHRRADTFEAVDDNAINRAIGFGLDLIAAIDASLAQTTETATATPA